MCLKFVYCHAHSAVSYINVLSFVGAHSLLLSQYCLILSVQGGRKQFPVNVPCVYIVCDVLLLIAACWARYLSYWFASLRQIFLILDKSPWVDIEYTPFSVPIKSKPMLKHFSFYRKSGWTCWSFPSAAPPPSPLEGLGLSLSSHSIHPWWCYAPVDILLLSQRVPCSLWCVSVFEFSVNTLKLCSVPWPKGPLFLIE